VLHVAACRYVGQDGILRRIVNPPAPGNEGTALFAACRYAGPNGKIGLPPDAKHILVAAMPLCGAANPGCSRLSGGFRA